MLVNGKEEKTDEELAEEYYYKTFPVTLNIGEEERKEKVMEIFLAGFNMARQHNKISDEEILSKGTSIDLEISELQPLQPGVFEVSDKDWYSLSEEEFNKIVENAKSLGWTTDDNYGSTLFQCCDGPHFSIIFKKGE